ncbi:ADP-ribosylglycohydrolase family protein [Catellatospora methionotrophica]|uniref:ADP-ribosylglycohydrolase family protein n=1 Tax=Catellatospora methionotrophica TaxID=121620 RepID=UPI00340CF847
MVNDDYAERVYAGVLGKVIAVYLGRPFEGWTHDKITAELGDVTYYVNDRHDVALKHHLLVVADDDISGTFVFPRVLARHRRRLPGRPQLTIAAVRAECTDQATIAAASRSLRHTFAGALPAHQGFFGICRPSRR